uniref:Uncharacterized protein n=1 Tax=Anguilla anguilla TaxID=7936 RepID=A0A0E9QG17_ANGAN
MLQCTNCVSLGFSLCLCDETVAPFPSIPPKLW